MRLAGSSENVEIKVSFQHDHSHDDHSHDENSDPAHSHEHSHEIVIMAMTVMFVPEKMHSVPAVQPQLYPIGDMPTPVLAASLNSIFRPPIAV